MDDATYERLRCSWLRTYRQAIVLGAALENRDKWKDVLREIGPVEQWSYEFRALFELIVGDVKPTESNVRASKRPLLLSESGGTVLQECVKWCTIYNLETRRGEIEKSLELTQDNEVRRQLQDEVDEIGRRLDAIRK